jgi:hypothetical protein
MILDIAGGVEVIKYRDASDRLTIGFSNIEASEYKNITQKIVHKFNLKPLDAEVIGFDEAFQDFKFDDKKISLEWDTWSGYMICAKNKNAEILVTEISDFVKDSIMI